MKQETRKWRLMSWLLSFAMVVGLLSGPVFVKQTAKAADEGEGEAVESNLQITLGEKEKGENYYSYPEANINSDDEEATRYAYLTVSVDSGYLAVPSTEVNGVQGIGLEYGDSVSVGFTDLTTKQDKNKYETVLFEFRSGDTDNSAEESQVEDFIQGIKFTTEATRSQKVTISATTRGNGLSMSAWVGEGEDARQVPVHYFNGHYYAYVPASSNGGYSWNEAFKEARGASFYTLEGYLATLTTRAEDRFLYEKYRGSNSAAENYVPLGWIGCTRFNANEVDGVPFYEMDQEKDNVDPPEKIWWLPDDPDGSKLEALYQKDRAEFLSQCREKLVWKWVSGPEAAEAAKAGKTGMAFGYQDSVVGDNMPDENGANDGGFVTYDGYFSNWKEWSESETHVEPNGGNGTTGQNMNYNEGFGYYGQYAYGRWNDHPDESDDKGYYLEFGGYPGDEDKLALETGQVVYTTTQDSEDYITDEEEYGHIFNPGPYIVNTNADGTTETDTVLNADISKIKFRNKEGDKITYQWCILTEDGNIEEIPDDYYYMEEYKDEDGKIYEAHKIPGGTRKNYTITDMTNGKKLIVRVTETGEDGYVAYGESAPYDTGATSISGQVAIKEQGIDEDGELVVKADITNVKPGKAHPGLTYQWYEKTGTIEKPIDGETGDTYTIPSEWSDPNVAPEDKKELVVKVTATGEEYKGTIPSDPYQIKSLIDGKPKIEPVNPEENLQIGSKVKANVDDIVPAEVQADLQCQWYIQNEDGSKEEIPGATNREYTLTKDTLGKDLVVEVSVNPNNTEYAGVKESDPFEAAPKDKTAIQGKPAIMNKTKDADGNDVNQAGSVLTAVLTDIKPQDVRSDLVYQWSIKDGDTVTPISKATGQDLVLTEDLLNKDIIVTVTVPDDNKKYQGSADSDPYDTTKTEKRDDKEQITGIIKIENQTLADDGISPVNREGTVLSANIAEVLPEGCHGTLSYQWYTLTVGDDGKVVSTPIEGAVHHNLILTEDTIDKTLTVTATADGVQYIGSVSSVPYDATRTNSGIGIDDTQDDLEEGRMIIKVTPTEEDTKYKVTEINGVVPEPMTVTHWVKNDETGEYEKTDTLEPDEDGYYLVNPGDQIRFEVDKDKNYVIREEKVTNTTTIITSPVINDDDIKKEIEDGTLNITVEPADPGYKYAILAKDGEAYVPIAVKKDENGNYVYDEPNGEVYWSTGEQDKVTFTKLPAEGTYKIVAIGTNVDSDLVGDMNLTPDQIDGGSHDIKADLSGSDASPSPSPSTDPSGSDASTSTDPSGSGASPSPSPSASALPSASPAAFASPAPSASAFTQAELDKAEKFIKDYCTNPKSKQVVTEVNDLTKDLILSGEKEWNQMTDQEKAAVNEKLKEKGCPYTYEELLAMAKDWKIPSFKMKKYLKKGTKSKLKLIKCNGATVICTSTKKKVATITKKGVIKAKKVGKATCTITVVKGKYTNRLEVKVIVKKKFKNAKELKKLKAKKIKTPTILLNKKRKIKKSTKVKIVGKTKGSKVKYKSLNKKCVSVNKKGKYKAKKKGNALIRSTVKQNKKTYILYLYVNAYK